MELNKYEIKMLETLSSYKVIFIITMLMSLTGFFLGCYLIITRENRSDFSFTVTAAIILASSYLNFCFVLLLQKFKSASEEAKKKNKAVCPKCFREFDIS